MEPALTVASLWLLFGGLHVGLATRRVRTALVARLGEVGFTALFSVVAAAFFTLLVRYYAAHRLEGVGGLALGGITAVRWALMPLIVGGLALALASLVTYPVSPMALFTEKVRPPRGLERVTRHPFFMGVAIAALAHVPLAPRLVGAMFQLGLASLAIAGAWHQDRKLVARRGRSYEEYLAQTSAIPFGAIVGGRQRLVPRELPWTALAVTLVVALWLRVVHGAIFAHGGGWVIGVTLGGAAVAALGSWRVARRARAGTAPALVSRRQALAFAGATLLGYVRIVHEAVGSTLYPYGPAAFGGPLGWHAAGLSLVAAGVLIGAATLGLLRLPVVPIAALLSLVGAAFVALQALGHGDFHFFAFTMLVAGLLVAFSARGTRERTTG
jgi:uncharacterized membrane protein